MRDDAIDLPWDTGRTFRVWRYGVGHSQLLLRSEGGTPAINVLFEAVEFMRLRRSYPQAVLRFATEDEYEEYGRLPPIRLLRVVVASPTDTGFIACSRMTVREAESLDEDTGHRGKLLLHVM